MSEALAFLAGLAKSCAKVSGERAAWPVSRSTPSVASLLGGRRGRRRRPRPVCPPRPRRRRATSSLQAACPVHRYLMREAAAPQLEGTDIVVTSSCDLLGSRFGRRTATPPYRSPPITISICRYRIRSAKPADQLAVANHMAVHRSNHIIPSHTPFNFDAEHCVQSVDVEHVGAFILTTFLGTWSAPPRSV